MNHAIAYMFVTVIIVFGALATARTHLQPLAQQAMGSISGRDLASVQAKGQATPQSSPSSNIFMKCVGTGLGQTTSPTASATPGQVQPSPTPLTAITATPTPSPQSSAAQTTMFRVEFSMEAANGQEISADTYLIDGTGARIKQISHSELLSATSASGLQFTAAPDSPFAMSIALAETGATDQSTQSAAKFQSVEGQITQLESFTNQSLGPVAVRCRVYLSRLQNQSAEPTN